MDNISLHQAVELALETGRIMLQCGSETHKVEEVMQRVCRGFGWTDYEAWVTLTGIFVSVKASDGQIVTSIKRIDFRTTDLEKLSRISNLTKDLIRRNCTQDINLKIKPMPMDEYKGALIAIDERKPYPVWVKLLCGGISCGCFTMLFGGGWNDFGVAIPIGILVRLVITYLGKARLNNFLLYAIGAGVLVWLAKMASMGSVGLSTDKIIIGGIMLMVPGLSITNAIRDTMAGDLTAGVSRTVEAFLIAIAIATGTGTMLKLWSLFMWAV